jgi:hypothetical protein
MRWLIALAFIFSFPLQSLPFITASRPANQTTPEITPLEPASQFGEQITFRVKIQPANQVKELVVFITPEGQPTVWQKISLDQVTAEGEFTQTIKARQLVLFPFSKVAYRFEVNFKNGESLPSPTHTFVYEDNRFNWQELNSGIFIIKWNSEDLTLGQEIANVAQQGLERSQQFLDVQPPEKLRIYAYSKASQLQEALQLTDQPWVAGHATPELAMIMISVPSGPEKTLELRRQIPHEIMHILQYQVMDKTYNQQPVWLVEGMASLAELSDNPEYRTVLKSTAREDMIPFQDLCLMFPREAAKAYQAYAQSQSFVSFLQQKFGISGLTALVGEYKNGVGCEEGVYSATGFSLNQLENRWEQESLGIDVGGLAIINLLPYVILGLLILLPAAMVFLPSRFTRPDLAEE